MDVPSTPRTDSGSILTIQPRPLDYQVTHSDVGTAPKTGIARIWAVEDARRCRLCPSGCIATVGRDRTRALCLITVHAFVSTKDAEFFALPVPARPISGQFGELGIGARA
jgi:hypothetical protein